MDRAAEIVFIVSVALIGYTYFAYAALLVVVTSIVQIVRDLRYLVSVQDRRAGLPADELPSLSVVVAAYNEEAVIEEKIANLLALEYPKDRLELIIASDGSSDRTNEIAAAHADRGITLKAYEERAGKITVLNRTIPEARGDVVVLSDANTIYEPDALLKLARHFSDERIGFVVGNLRLTSPTKEFQSEGLYWRYEMMLKFLENKLGVALIANGGIYAIRRSTFRPLPPDTITDDLMIPLRITEQGLLGRFEPEAIAHEETGKDLRAEFTRHARIGAGNFQSLWRAPAMLNPFRTRAMFSYLSHKVLRWLVPFFMILAAASNACLLGRSIFQVTMALQGAFYLFALLGWLVRRPRVLAKLFALPHYLVGINAALLVGFVRCITGRQRVIWRRTER